MYILYFDWFFIFFYCTFVLQTIEFTTLLLVHSFGNTFGLKCMPLSFQMNRSSSECNGFGWWCFILPHAYYFSTDDRWWWYILEGHIRKISIFLPSFDWCLIKTWRHCWKPHYIHRYNFFLFFFKVFLEYNFNTNWYALIDYFLDNMYYLLGKTLYTCLPQFEASPLSIGRWQRCFWFRLKAFDYTILYSYWQRYQSWRLGWFSNS